MESINNTAALATITAASILVISQQQTVGLNNIKKTRQRKERRWWVRPYLSEDNRSTQGAQCLLNEMRLNDLESFFNYTRMNPTTFDKLLCFLGPYLTKQRVVRSPIPPATKLALTLRYLASGDSQASISYAFRLGKATTCVAIHETIKVLWLVIGEKVLTAPKAANWLEIADGFNKRWNFPHCVGAIDGKHVRITAPPHSGSEFFNYKNYFSTILLAVCDYRYRFVAIDVGAQGRQSDGGVLKNSKMGQKFNDGAMDLPPAKEIFPGGPVLPFYLLGDEAFGLKTWLVTPYSGKSSGNLSYSKLIFNYRQSRARRIIENAFGMLVSRWRILRNALTVSTDNSDEVVLAVVCLHNYCLMEEESEKAHQKKYFIPNLVDRENYNTGEVTLGSWRTDLNALPQIGRQGGYNSTLSAIENRDILAEHFMTDGSIPWQWSIL